jgi:hypothetical protein
MSPFQKESIEVFGVPPPINAITSLNLYSSHFSINRTVSISNLT